MCIKVIIITLRYVREACFLTLVVFSGLHAIFKIFSKYLRLGCYSIRDIQDWDVDPKVHASSSDGLCMLRMWGSRDFCVVIMLIPRNPCTDTLCALGLGLVQFRLLWPVTFFIRPIFMSWAVRAAHFPTFLISI